jgi:hypothetical protein
VASERFTRLACALVVVVGGGVGCAEPQVSLRLTKDPDLAIAPEFIRFVFPIEGRDALEEGPFSKAAIDAERFAAIPPGLSFSVDVIGCLQGDRASCEEETSFVGRGCAGPFSRERDTELVIDVVLLPTAEGNEACPIPPV